MAQIEMRYQSLGRCGTKVSVLGLGGWTTFGGTVKDEGAIRAIIEAAFEAGINFFDSADIYANGESEIMMGRALRDFPRYRLVLSSKLFWPMSEDANDKGLSRKHIMESVERSLKRMGTDYFDIYFCHRFDEETPLEETARAMDDLVHQGKIIYWGTSEWSGAQLQETNLLCRKHNLYSPQVEQPQYSLLVRSRLEKEIKPKAAKFGMGLVVWSPLASGVLSGKYDNGVPENSRLAQMTWLKERHLNKDTVDRIRRMKELADQQGCTRAQLAIAWTAAQPGVSSVITGATRLEQLRENLGAMSVSITPELNRRLQALFPPRKG